MENCKVCGTQMKQIPAGVSRSTGKPYEAFVACPNRCKQQRKTEGNSNEGMKIIGEMLADMQTKINAIYDIINKEMPQE